MGRSYYAMRYRFNGSDTFLLWYDADQDRVMVDEVGRILSFDSLEKLQQWTNAHGWEADINEPPFYDLDKILKWSEHPELDTVDCESLLNAWNLFMDVRAGLEQRNVCRDDPENNNIYDKLFFGSNLPVITPPGAHYMPHWSEEEVRRLCNILAEGLRLLRDRVYSIENITGI